MVGIVVVSHSPRLAHAAVELALQMVHGPAPRIEIAAGTSTVTVRLHCTASVARGVVGVPADSALWLDGPLRTAAVRRPEGSA